MAPDAPISAADEKHAALRECTRDFLVRARHVFSDEPNSSIDRYYRLRINASLDPDQDDIEAIIKVGGIGTNCIRCSNLRTISYRNRKSENRSRVRKYCRHLSAYVLENCENCKGRARIRLLKPTTQELVRKKDVTAPAASRASTKKNTKAPVAGSLAGRPGNKGLNPIKKIIKKGPKAVSFKQSTKPQFNSRLRAFSCLLEK